jgi:CheY-like chemotaxis protein
MTRHANKMNAKRVLVAEDDDLLREIVCAGLADEGFDVVAASDGAVALELFRERGPYDALLLDEEMPHLTGRQLLARLRAAGERVAALLISGNLEIDDDERTNLGVARVIRKPASLDDICEALHQEIEGQAAI